SNYCSISGNGEESQIASSTGKIISYGTVSGVSVTNEYSNSLKVLMNDANLLNSFELVEGTQEYSFENLKDTFDIKYILEGYTVSDVSEFTLANVSKSTITKQTITVTKSE
ncbi:MAG: hypothetical protein K6E20_03505, partial [Acholeplasmatales bacterium]|nr:hypothetical protein [Acholeplasmatales bacterium]